MSEFFYFFVGVVGGIIGAKVFHFVITCWLKKIAEKTKTDIDDLILKAVTKPFYVLVILAGIYFGLKSLSFLKPYFSSIEKVFFVGFVLLISLMVVRVLSIFTSRWLKVQKKYEKTPKLVNTLLTLGIYLIALLLILEYFNIKITPLIATFGIGGLVVGLALQNTISNFFAGLYVISERGINVGDFLELDNGISGWVEDVGWRSTRIRTLPNTIVIIPNSKLAESVIINQSLPEKQMSAVVECGVAYTSDLERVEKITLEVARKIQKEVPGAVRTFEPFMRYHTFGDSNINFSVILRVEKPGDRYLVIHEFIKALKKRYDEERIEISWPVRKIYYGKE